MIYFDGNFVWGKDYLLVIFVKYSFPIQSYLRHFIYFTIQCALRFNRNEAAGNTSRFMNSQTNVPMIHNVCNLGFCSVQYSSEKFLIITSYYLYLVSAAFQQTVALLLMYSMLITYWSSFKPNNFQHKWVSLPSDLIINDLIS